MSSPCCSLTCLGYPGASSHPPPSTLLPPTQVWTTAVQSPLTASQPAVLAHTPPSPSPTKLWLAISHHGRSPRPRQAHPWNPCETELPHSPSLDCYITTPKEIEHGLGEWPPPQAFQSNSPRAAHTIDSAHSSSYHHHISCQACSQGLSQFP